MNFSPLLPVYLSALTLCEVQLSLSIPHARSPARWSGLVISLTPSSLPFLTAGFSRCADLPPHPTDDVTHLDLSHNQLRDLDDLIDFLARHPHLRTVALHGNPVRAHPHLRAALRGSCPGVTVVIPSPVPQPDPEEDGSRASSRAPSPTRDESPRRLHAVPASPKRRCDTPAPGTGDILAAVMSMLEASGVDLDEDLHQDVASGERDKSPSRPSIRTTESSPRIPPRHDSTSMSPSPSVSTSQHLLRSVLWDLRSSVGLGSEGEGKDERDREAIVPTTTAPAGSSDPSDHPGSHSMDRLYLRQWDMARILPTTWASASASPSLRASVEDLEARVRVAESQALAVRQRRRVEADRQAHEAREDASLRRVLTVVAALISSIKAAAPPPVTVEAGVDATTITKKKVKKNKKVRTNATKNAPEKVVTDEMEKEGIRSSANDHHLVDDPGAMRGTLVLPPPKRRIPTDASVSTTRRMRGSMVMTAASGMVVEAHEDEHEDVVKGEVEDDALSTTSTSSSTSTDAPADHHHRRRQHLNHHDRRAEERWDRLYEDLRAESELRYRLREELALCLHDLTAAQTAQMGLARDLSVESTARRAAEDRVLRLRAQLQASDAVLAQAERVLEDQTAALQAATEAGVVENSIRRDRNPAPLDSPSTASMGALAAAWQQATTDAERLARTVTSLTERNTEVTDERDALATELTEVRAAAAAAADVASADREALEAKLRAAEDELTVLKEVSEARASELARRDAEFGVLRSRVVALLALCGRQADLLDVADAAVGSTDDRLSFALERLALVVGEAAPHVGEVLLGDGVADRVDRVDRSTTTTTMSKSKSTTATATATVTAIEVEIDRLRHERWVLFERVRKLGTALASSSRTIAEHERAMGMVQEEVTAARAATLAAEHDRDAAQARAIDLATQVETLSVAAAARDQTSSASASAESRVDLEGRLAAAERRATEAQARADTYEHEVREATAQVIAAQDAAQTTRDLHETAIASHRAAEVAAAQDRAALAADLATWRRRAEDAEAVAERRARDVLGSQEDARRRVEAAERRVEEVDRLVADSDRRRREADAQSESVRLELHRAKMDAERVQIEIEKARAETDRLREAKEMVMDRLRETLEQVRAEHASAVVRVREEAGAQSERRVQILREDHREILAGLKEELKEHARRLREAQEETRRAEGERDEARAQMTMVKHKEEEKHGDVDRARAAQLAEELAAVQRQLQIRDELVRGLRGEREVLVSLLRGALPGAQQGGKGSVHGVGWPAQAPGTEVAGVGVGVLTPQTPVRADGAGAGAGATPQKKTGEDVAHLRLTPATAEAAPVPPARAAAHVARTIAPMNSTETNPLALTTTDLSERLDRLADISI